MKNKNLPVQLTIAGGGNIEAQILNKIKKLGISLLNCWIDDSELRLLLSEADVVIIPYKQASQSGPASIAVALGIPVIATRVGGLTEQVYDGVNGILIKPNSPEEIVKAVEQILAQPETLNRFSEGAKSLRENELSWNNTAKEMAKHFRKF
ncbi:MAG: glycosyltransferase family 4 protein, partial [candidate division WOR-3 bacterium]